jgi:hypothetical protein
MRKTTIFYPNGSGLELDIEFSEDAELYTHGVCIETIKFQQSPDLFSEFTEKAIEKMELTLSRMLRA